MSDSWFWTGVLIVIVILGGLFAYAYVNSPNPPNPYDIFAKGTVTMARSYSSATGWWGGQELHSDVQVTLNTTGLKVEYVPKWSNNTYCTPSLCTPQVKVNSTYTIPITQITFHYSCSYYKQGDNVTVQWHISYSKFFSLPPYNPPNATTFQNTGSIIGVPSGC